MTGIICTLGTTTDDRSVLEDMIASGMSCARMNTAYASIGDYQKRLDLLRSVAHIPVMMDLKGPEARLISDRPYPIDKGTYVDIGFRDETISFNKDFYKDLVLKDDIYLENGTIHLKVRCKRDRQVRLEVIDPGEGEIRSGMGVNVPGRYLDVERLSAKDYSVIDFAIQNHVEYLALSFVRDHQDILNLEQAIENIRDMYPGSIRPKMVAKIEDSYGIDNLDAIIKSAAEEGQELDVMAARGDLGVELPIEKLPFAQQQIIRTCKKHNTYVITATDLLGSMQYGYMPTRSEVCDVYNALNMGSDALMLSGETSNSRNPVGAVQMLHSIIEKYEKNFNRYPEA